MMLTLNFSTVPSLYTHGRRYINHAIAVSFAEVAMIESAGLIEFVQNSTVRQYMQPQPQQMVGIATFNFPTPPIPLDYPFEIP
jgi:hypothetical protein